MSLIIMEGMIQKEGKAGYKNTMCGKCNLLLQYSVTWLSKALPNIFICKTHSAPSRGLGVYIVDTIYVL